MPVLNCRQVERVWDKNELKDFTKNELIALFVNCDSFWIKQGKRKGANAKIYEGNKRRVNAELKRRRTHNAKVYYDYAYHAF